MKWRGLILIVLVIGGYQYWSGREIEQTDGVLVPTEPSQTSFSNKNSFKHNGYKISPQAKFDITARVLGRENYRLGRESDLSPIDLALGWKNMSDQRVLEKMEISQSNRFYFWRVKDYPIPRNEIVSSSANMHMIPANSVVASKLGEVHKGHVVRLKGYLVNISADDGWSWNSSLERTDSGNGACEIIWVEQAEIIS